MSKADEIREQIANAQAAGEDTRQLQEELSWAELEEAS